MKSTKVQTLSALRMRGIAKWWDGSRLCSCLPQVARGESDTG